MSKWDRKEASAMDLPEIDLEELKKLKEKNFEEQLEFIKLYVQWLKEHKVKIEKVR